MVGFGDEQPAFACRQDGEAAGFKQWFCPYALTGASSAQTADRS